MQKYRIKKEFTKKNEDGLWTHIYEVGDIVEYNEWVDGWFLPESNPKCRVYQWNKLTKDDIDKHPEIFEVII